MVAQAPPPRSRLPGVPGFIGLEYGRASALAMLLFLIVLAVGVLALRWFRRTEVEL